MRRKRKQVRETPRPAESHAKSLPAILLLNRTPFYLRWRDSSREIVSIKLKWDGPKPETVLLTLGFHLKQKKKIDVR